MIPSLCLPYYNSELLTPIPLAAMGKTLRASNSPCTSEGGMSRLCSTLLSSPAGSLSSPAASDTSMSEAVRAQAAMAATASCGRNNLPPFCHNEKLTRSWWESGGHSSHQAWAVLALQGEIGILTSAGLHNYTENYFQSYACRHRHGIRRCHISHTYSIRAGENILIWSKLYYHFSAQIYM